MMIMMMLYNSFDHEFDEYQMLLMITALIIQKCDNKISRRIGLAGFDNPMRDSKTEEVKRHIGQVRKSSKMRIFRKT